MVATPHSISRVAIASTNPASIRPARESGELQPTTPIQPPARKLTLVKRPANTGIASWYGAVLDGHLTASGERFDMNMMTAAHRTLPFGTLFRVVDLHTGKSVVVKINDRGILFPERIIDLSRGAADRLGIRKSGVTSVRLEILKKLPVVDEQYASATPLPQAGN